LLAGLHGTLPPEMLIAQPRAAKAGPTQSQAAERQEAQLFAAIVGQTAPVAPGLSVQPGEGLRASLSRWIIYIVLILAVALPFIIQRPLLSRTIEPIPAVTGLFDQVNSLQSNAKVLVAFDYDPATSGEMDVVAQALVGHLMDQGVQIAAVSLFPAGPATAQSLLDTMAAEHSSYIGEYGKRYVNLGFIPGQATAVRLLGQSLENAVPSDFQGTPLTNLPVMEGVDSVEGFDLIIELAAGQDTLRAWIEQVGAPFQRPLGAGVSASTEPIARAYYETEPRQLLGVVAGVPGAAMYESLRTNQKLPGSTMETRLDAQFGGHLVFILVLLVGSGIYVLQSATGRKH
jgi:hypothetical protein